MTKQMKYHLTADIKSTGESIEMDANSISPMMKVLREHLKYQFDRAPDFELPDGRSIRTQLLTYRIWSNEDLTLMMHVYREDPLPIKETVAGAMRDYLPIPADPNNMVSVHRIRDVDAMAALATTRLQKFMD